MAGTEPIRCVTYRFRLFLVVKKSPIIYILPTNYENLNDTNNDDHDN